jgi:hypothetical protein
MGSYLTRTRAWCYIAFYDEYVGRHINTSAGLSVLFFIPMYIYGLNVNRIVEQNGNHYLYNWQFWDKRNRVCHNLIMEHFEVHKEQLEDLIVDLNTKGPVVFEDLPIREKTRPCTMNDFALIDEMSGLNDFLDNFMQNHNLPETSKERIRAYMTRYDSPVPREIALNELRMSMWGDQR